MLSLNCLNAKEGATAAKRDLLINAGELIQDRYFEKYLGFKICYFGEEDLLLFPQEMRGCGFILS